MIIWGSGGKSVALGSPEYRRCETCERDRQFNVVLHYRYFHLYWILRAVTEKKYYLLCEACSRGWELDKQLGEGRFSASAIPFMDRFGLLIGLSAVGLLIAIAAVSG